MTGDRETYLAAIKLASDKKARCAALTRSHQIRQFEIELYWKRAHYFWLLQAAVFAAVGLTWKSAGNGVSSIAGLHFTNHATVWVKTGTLAFGENVTNNGGTFQASPGAVIQFNGTGHRVFGSNTTFSGSGAHVLSSFVRRVRRTALNPHS